jgi:hypothetical protein
VHQISLHVQAGCVGVGVGGNVGVGVGVGMCVGVGVGVGKIGHGSSYGHEFKSVCGVCSVQL